MLRSLCALAFLLALTSPAVGQFESDSNLPVEITADAMEWMNAEGIAIARGNADAVQGRYRLHADVLTAYINQAGGASPNRIRRIDAEGNVTLTTPTESARGRAGTYDVEGKVVILEGSVILTQGTTVLRGEHLVMDLVSGRSTLQGGTSGVIEPAEDGRVKMIFEPESGN
jgi:lipopolysaccharide export system protein LptA